MLVGLCIRQGAECENLKLTSLTAPVFTKRFDLSKHAIDLRSFVNKLRHIVYELSDNKEKKGKNIIQIFWNVNGYERKI